MKVVCILLGKKPQSQSFLASLLASGYTPVRVYIRLKNRRSFSGCIMLNRGTWVLITSTLQMLTSCCLLLLKIFGDAVLRLIITLFRKDVFGLYPLYDLLFSANLKPYHFSSTRDKGFIEELRRIGPDVIVTNAGIIPPEVIASARIGVLNCHPGILPEFRGCNTVAWAIYTDRPVGMTVHLMEEGIDTGPVLFTRVSPKFDRRPGESLEVYDRRLKDLEAGPLLAEAIGMLEQGVITPIPQTEKYGRYWQKMPPGGKAEVRRQISAYDGAVRGKQRDQ